MLDDDIISTYYKVEYNKIPGIFKFNKVKLVIVSILIAILFLAMMLILAVIPNTRELIPIVYGWGTYESVPFAAYDLNLVSLMIWCGVGIILLAAWILIAVQLEKNAYAKASRFASQESQWQSKRDYSEWQALKRENGQDF